MPVIEIKVNGDSFQLQSGLTLVSTIMGVSNSNDKTIFLSREDDIDIPLLPDEFLTLRGGELFFTGDSCLEDNPPVRNEIKPEFNGSHGISLAVAKITGRDLKALDDKFPNGRLFIDIEDAVDAEILDDMMVAVQNADSYFVIPSVSDSDDDAIDLENCAQNDRRPPQTKKYRIRIDGEKYIVEKAQVSGVAILALAGKTLDEWSLNQKEVDGKRIKIDGGVVDLSKPGIERFETVTRQAQQGHE